MPDCLICGEPLVLVAKHYESVMLGRLEYDDPECVNPECKVYGSCAARDGETPDAPKEWR